MSLERIDASRYVVGVITRDAGTKPKLEWLPISVLRIDRTYQRQIQDRGAKNVRRIAAEFDWAKFTPVVVAQIAGGLYAIIDGQHRTTAAAARNIKDVPCQIVEADYERQAEAFAAINAQVTAITPLQLHAARLAAGDAAALELVAACKAGGVTICAYPVPASKMHVGETLAVGVLANLLKLHGRAVLVSALSCVTRTRDGNTGMVRGPVITALCRALEAEPGWRKHKDLLKAMEQFDFSAAYVKASRDAAAERCSLAAKLLDLVCNHLDRRLKVAA